MRKDKKKWAILLITILSILCIGVNVYAHSGRTDSSGGHRDNKNKSGLGSYHYHCGGYPAHLHKNGVCPYSSTKSNKSNTKSSSKSSSKPKTKSSTNSTTTKKDNTIKASSVQIKEKSNNINMINDTIKEETQNSIVDYKTNTIDDINSNIKSSEKESEKSSNPIGGILGLGILGGGSYLGYKVYKSKND